MADIRNLFELQDALVANIKRTKPTATDFSRLLTAFGTGELPRGLLRRRLIELERWQKVGKWGQHEQVEFARLVDDVIAFRNPLEKLLTLLFMSPNDFTYSLWVEVEVTAKRRDHSVEVPANLFAGYDWVTDESSVPVGYERSTS